MLLRKQKNINRRARRGRRGSSSQKEKTRIFFQSFRISAISAISAVHRFFGFVQNDKNRDGVLLDAVIPVTQDVPTFFPLQIY
jgi:hypothetical protein